MLPYMVKVVQMGFRKDFEVRRCWIIQMGTTCHPQMCFYVGDRGRSHT